MNKRRPPIDRFMEKVNQSAPNGCWLWTAGRDSSGYGVFNYFHSNKSTSHRWAYEHFIGPVPEGLELDHLCRNRACVNPDHLEPVTHAENARRGTAGWNTRAKTHCPKGHPYDEANTYRPPGANARHCRACRTEQRHSRARRKAVNP